MIQCKHFGPCSGCQFLDLPYSTQSQNKQEKLQSLFDKDLIEWIPLSQETGFLHKIQLPLAFQDKKLVIGCRSKNGGGIENQTECAIQDPDLTLLAQELKNWVETANVPLYREETKTGWLRAVHLRKGAATQEILVTLCSAGAIQDPTRFKKSIVQFLGELTLKGSLKGKVVGILESLDYNSSKISEKAFVWWGRDYFREKLGLLQLRLKAATPWIPNPEAAKNLYSALGQFIPKDSRVLHLNAHAGMMTLWLSKQASKIVSIEKNYQNHKHSVEMISLNKIKNISSLRGDVLELLPQWNRRSFHSCILELTRTGIESEMLRLLENSTFKQIILLSLSAEQLDSEFKKLSSFCSLKKVVGVDILPHTVSQMNFIVLEKHEKVAQKKVRQNKTEASSNSEIPLGEYD